MSEAGNSSRKRPFSNLATTQIQTTGGSSSTHLNTATASREPPPRARMRVSTGALEFTTAAAPSFDYETAELQSQIQDLKTSLEHERTLRTLDQRRFEQTQTRLQRQVQFAVEEASDAKTLLDDLRNQTDLHTEQLRNAKADAIRQLRDCQARLAVAHTDSVSEDQMQVALEAQQTLQAQLDARDQEVSALRQELAQVIAKERSKLSSAASSPHTSEKHATPIRLLETAPPTVMSELNRTRIQLAETERMYRQLRRKTDGLQEKAQQLVQQREAARAATRRVGQVENELRDLRNRHERSGASLESWLTFGQGLRKALSLDSTPHQQDGPPEVATVLRHLDDLHESAAVLAKDKAAFQKQVEALTEKRNLLNETITQKEIEMTRLASSYRELEHKFHQSELQLSTLRAQEGIWRREADSLRSLLQTYSDSAPMSPDAKPSLANKSLELSLSTARDELQLATQERERVANELDAALASKLELKAEHDRVTNKFEKLREALMAERAKAEAAEDRARQAETLAGKGSYNEDETRILHLRENPASEAIRASYESEIRSLRSQLEDTMEQNPITSVSAAAAPEVDPSKLHQRLKEQFKERSGLYREGVRLLTGFKIDMLGDDDRPMFKIRSDYAEHEQDQLLFAWPKSKNVLSLDLVETDFAKLLTTTDSYSYMTKFSSVPAFMASVQLGLFEKTTLQY